MKGAYESLKQAKELSPSYPDVYKISAFIKAQADDILGAQEDYEQAVDLAPGSPQVLYFYAGFRLRKLDDTSGSLELILRAESFDHQSLDIKQLKARILTFLGRYQEADVIFMDIIEKYTEMPGRFQRITTHMAINCLKRWADRGIEQKDFEDSWSRCDRALDLSMRAISKWSDDVYIRGELCGMLCNALTTGVQRRDGTAVDKCVRVLCDNWGVLDACEGFEHVGRQAERAMASGIISSHLTTELMDLLSRLQPHREEVLSGKIVRVIRERGFCFVSSDIDGQELFLHASDLGDGVRWDDIKPGVRVRFILGENSSGLCARGVQLSQQFKE